MLRKKRKRAVAVLVNGIVHAIVELEPAFVAASEEPFGVYSEYPLLTLTKAARDQKIRDQVDPLVRLLCETRPLAPHVIYQRPFPRMTWRVAPRTHAQINCMSCLVALTR